MVNLSVYKSYGIQDLCKKKEIEKLNSEINISDNEVVLDIRDCFIDYPTTGILLNKILKDLSVRPGTKKISIIYNFHHTEHELLACLFDECEFFDSINFKEKPFDDIKKEIITKLIASSTIIEIRLTKISGTEEQILIYGA